MEKDEKTAKELNPKIGSIIKTERTIDECDEIVEEARAAITTTNNILDHYIDARMLGDSSNESIVFLDNLSKALITIENNLKVTKEASIALNKLNIRLKELIIKYDNRKKLQEDLNKYLTLYNREPDKIRVGTDELGYGIYEDNPKKNEYKAKVEELNEKLDIIEKEISIIQNMIDAQYTNIKTRFSELSNLDSLVENSSFNIRLNKNRNNIYGTNKLTIMTGKEIKDALTGYNVYSSKRHLYLPACTGFNDDEEYFMINSKISPIDYTKYIGENGLYQNVGFKGSRCDQLTFNYNSDMVDGKYTAKEKFGNETNIYSFITYYQIPGAKRNDERAITSYINEDGTVDNEAKELFSLIYDEVSNGKPIGLQVVIRDKNSKIVNGQKHWISVVGFSTSISKVEDLRSDNLVVIDCESGQLKVNDKPIKAVYDDRLDNGNSEGVVYRTATYDPLFRKLNLGLYGNSRNSTKVMNVVKEMKRQVDLYGTDEANEAYTLEDYLSNKAQLTQEEQDEILRTRKEQYMMAGIDTKGLTYDEISMPIHLMSPKLFRTRFNRLYANSDSDKLK